MTVHDLNLAAQYCDRLLLLNQGKLISNDVPKKVLTSQVLTGVFGLYCHQDLDPITQSPRVSFYLKDPLITKKDMSLVK
jgi:iron complex transport system ATP-binding protein